MTLGFARFRGSPTAWWSLQSSFSVPQGSGQEISLSQIFRQAPSSISPKASGLQLRFLFLS